MSLFVCDGKRFGEQLALMYKDAFSEKSEMLTVMPSSAALVEGPHYVTLLS